jgi:soluble lytic murein transglycosylase-like protein
MRRTTVLLFFVAGQMLAAAAETPLDSGLFSVETAGTDALRAGAWRQALDELRAATTPAGLLKRGIACLRNGDSIGALAAFTPGPADDAELGLFALELMGDIIAGSRPEQALDCYEKALRTGVPGRFRNRIFEKISLLTGIDTDRVATSPLWPDYSLWWNAKKPAPPETLCTVFDATIATGNWEQVDSLMGRTFTALSDSGQCAVAEAVCCSPAADSLLSAAAFFLLGKAAADCGRYATAERLFAASRKKPDFAATVGEQEVVKIRGRIFFKQRKYDGAIALLTGYVRRFGYESDVGLLIARAYKSVDNNDEAADWYDRFIAGTPRYPAMAEILWRRAWIEEERGKPRTAAAYYKRIYRYYQRSSRAEESLLRCALSLFRDEKYGEALRELSPFEAKYRVSSLRPASRYWKAKSLFGINRADSARAVLAELARQEPYDYYAQRARDLLLLYGDSAAARFCLDTAGDIGRAVRWLDSAAPPSGTVLSADDSLSIRRGLFLAATGSADDAAMFVEPVELAFPENLSLEFRIAKFYRGIGAVTQASRSGRRLAWRIPEEFRASIPLPVYTVMYPFYFGDFVNREAARHRLDPALVLAVIRQESIFNAEIVSRAGAVGLMQIMPSTGEEIARLLGERFCVDSLTVPSVNIRYGTFYLRRLLDQFSGNEVLALASYNGGPDNASEWYVRGREKDFDLFVEDIGFSETRNYVKKVLGNYWFYRRLFRAGNTNLYIKE